MSSDQYIKKERSVNKEMRKKIKSLWLMASAYFDDVIEERPIGGNAANVGNPYGEFREDLEPGFGTKLTVGGATGIKMIVELKIQIPKKEGI